MASVEQVAQERYRLRTLGGFSVLRRVELEVDGWEDTGLGEKPCALLAYLIWRGNDVPRAALAELLWDGTERARARNSLRQALFRIRAVLGASAVVEGSEGVRLAQTLALDLPQLRRESGSASELTPVEPGRLRTFGQSALIRGRAFTAWCTEVRSGLDRPTSAQENERTALARAITTADARTRQEGVAGPSVRWLSGLWDVAQRGTPISAWLPDCLAPAPQSTIDGFAEACRSDGGRIAKVNTRGPTYMPYALERDLAAVLWSMPGAAGIQPEHREAIDRVSAGQRAQPSVLHSAILDLIAAVAEDAPLLVCVEEPERYSTGALRGLVSGLTAQAACPVLLLLAARDGVVPVSPLCVTAPQDSADGASGRRSGESRVR